MHLRERHLTPIALRRLRLHPVLGVLGARQVGKSTWLRDLVGPKMRADYVTFDKKAARGRAEKAPEFFLLSLTRQLRRTGIIDEAQKVPAIFDAIKAVVDEHRRPGLLLITGSAEFSRRTGIRESLTGRIGLLRLFPLTLAELGRRRFVSPWVGLNPSSLSSTPQEIELWIERGGMPGICCLRDPEERHALWDSWLDATCHRDLLQFEGFAPDGDLAEDILGALATIRTPTAAEAARALRVDSRKVQKHLAALETLFAVQRIDPHPLGVGKARYLPFDAGLAWHLGSSRERRIAIWAMNECLAQNSYAGAGRMRLTHYESSKHSQMDFVIEKDGHTTAILLCQEESPGTYVLRTVEAFQKKAPGATVLVLTPGTEIAGIGPRCSAVSWMAMG